MSRGMVPPTLPSDTYTLSPAPLPSSLAPPSKRPKLSLNTANVPSMFGGKRSTSLRLETLSATSPTTRNTFRNAHDRPVSHFHPLTPLADDHEPTTPRSAAPSLSSSPSCGSSMSTHDSMTCSPPDPASSRRTSTTVFFPRPARHHPMRTILLPTDSTHPPVASRAKKAVGFRAPLEEEIHTIKYTWKHSDIESSLASISTLDLPASQTWVEARTPEGAWLKRKNASSSSGSADDLDVPPLVPETTIDDNSDRVEPDSPFSCPATPIAGRAKHEREWAWTLAPIAPVSTPHHDVDSEPAIRQEDTQTV